MPGGRSAGRSPCCQWPSANLERSRRPVQQPSSERRFNELAAKVVAFAADRDTQALGQTLGDTTLGPRVVRLWADLTGNKGRLLGTRVLGSVMLGAGDGPATYVRATFAHDTTVYRVWWDWDGGFLSIHDGVDVPARHVLFPLTERDFLAWDMFDNHAVRLHFELPSQGHARALTVETPSGSIRAETIPSAGPE
jgi:hypothetical protein